MKSNKKLARLAFGWMCCIGVFMVNNDASADQNTLEVKAISASMHEMSVDKFVPLVLELCEPTLPILALVSVDVFDYFGNIAIPRGSKFVGQYVGVKNGRNIVYWSGLQLPGVDGTKKISPPIFAVMRDGSFGIATLSPGASIGARIKEPVLVN